MGWGAVCRPQDPGFPSQYVDRFPARWQGNNQHAHYHPRFTPDGKAVLYTSDLTSYSNMYLVEVGVSRDRAHPELSSLPASQIAASYATMVAVLDK